MTSTARGQPFPTVGVEEEFLLVDAVSGFPAERNLAVARLADGRGLHLALEFARCQVEIDTSVTSSATDLRSELISLRHTLAEAANVAGAKLLAIGVPPIGLAHFTLTDSSRYRMISKHFGNLTYGQCVCGCHVHVAMPDRETALQVSNYLRPWLPTLLALTANSAVYAGSDTGHASWRAVLQSQWPVSGPPPYFRSKQHYDGVVDELTETGAILDEHMIYWDVRPSSHLPTVEIRISDVPATIEETVTLATLVRALAITALGELAQGRTAPDIGTDVLRAAKWKAAHDGLSGVGYDVEHRRIVPARILVQSLVALVTPALEDLGELGNVIESVQNSVTNGNGATGQLDALRSGGLDAVINASARATVETSSTRFGSSRLARQPKPT